MTTSKVARVFILLLFALAMPFTASAQEQLAVQFLKQYLEPETQIIFNDQVGILRRDVDLMDEQFNKLPPLNLKSLNANSLYSNFEEPILLNPNPETELYLLLESKGLLNVRVSNFRLIDNKAIDQTVSPLMQSLWVTTLKLIPAVAEVSFEQKINDTNEIQTRAFRLHMAVYHFSGKKNFSIIFGYNIRSVDLVDRVVFDSSFSTVELDLLMAGLVTDVIAPTLNAQPNL